MGYLERFICPKQHGGEDSAQKFLMLLRLPFDRSIKSDIFNLQVLASKLCPRLLSVVEVDTLHHYQQCGPSYMAEIARAP